ncbi:MAG: hypothetical protein Terrestrivirus14_2 [Terrestrivirus sp.]|uniref:Uncharacterized protein n=1 Tax=Terrestrivirus sp. TaxID=2487775 RepID=A0A3G4ZT24_9VIRU|nr:MAG: hypothetical protein Terrestrivirus14_2 [Terrestrivirus sp.]
MEQFPEFNIKYYCHHFNVNNNNNNTDEQNLELFCNKYSEVYNHFCDEHKTNNQNVITQSIQNHCQAVTKTIKSGLSKVENVSGMVNKAKECSKVFDVFCKNKWYINKYPSFKNQILMKLMDFDEDDNLQDKQISDALNINYYKHDLFPDLFGIDPVKIIVDNIETVDDKLNATGEKSIDLEIEI